MQRFLSDAKARPTGAAEAERILEGAQAQADAEAAFYREHLKKEKQRGSAGVAATADVAMPGAQVGSAAKQPPSQQTASQQMGPHQIGSQQTASQQPPSKQMGLQPMCVTKTFSASSQQAREGMLPAPSFSVLSPNASDPPSMEIGGGVVRSGHLALRHVGTSLDETAAADDEIGWAGDSIRNPGDEADGAVDETLCNETEGTIDETLCNETEGAFQNAAVACGGAAAEANRLVAEEVAALGLDVEVEAAAAERAREARMEARTADDLLGQVSGLNLSYFLSTCCR
jgi:hypothetical protein